MAHRVISSGRDPTGLGRWCWTCYRGQHDVTLRIITAYCPGGSASSGERTIFWQHQRYLDSQFDNRTPPEAMLEDLCKDLQLWREAGDQLVVMLDANESVTSSHICKTFQALGLVEAITTAHSAHGTVPIYQRGQHPIDGIFLSPTLSIVQGGYFPSWAAPSDHRPIWIRLKMDQALGYNMDSLISPSARLLKLQDPTCANRFLAYYENYIQRHSLHLTSFEIQEAMLHQPFSPSLQRRCYNRLRIIRLNGLLAAERHCRKLRMGKVPWSRTLQHVMDESALCKAVVLQKEGTRVSTRFITRLEKAASIKNSLKNTFIESSKLLKEACQRYYTLKKDADDLRESWLKDLAAIKAKEAGGSQDAIYKSSIKRAATSSGPMASKNIG